MSDDVWVTTSSAPVKAGSGTLGQDGWSAFLQTAVGDDADGVYIFDVRAICALTSADSVEMM